MDVESSNSSRLSMTTSTTFDCNPGCRSRQHAAQLISAITKGSDLQTHLFISRCHSAESITDEFGRNLLHVAASCGRDDVVEWLIDQLGASVAALDYESGWTALHRALFYGQLSTARLLISHGSSLWKRDRDGLTPLDIVMKDRMPHIEFLHTGLDELFTWGANFNFTLGHENMQPRKMPEQVETFRKQGISIRKVAMSKYHSVFCSDNGHVYTCGHGLGGRLGQGDEKTYLVPRLVDLLKKEVCVEVAAAANHTLLLMENGTVYSCGMNNFSQLAQFPPPSKSLTPKQVNCKVLKVRQVVGICARRFHSVFYTSDTVFTCGLNAGQLGHYKVGGEILVSQPRPVTALCHKDTHIQMVTASDAATVVVTTKGDVYALHEFQCRKIVSKWLDIVLVACSGGHLDSSIDSDSLSEHGGSALTVALLTSTGKVYLCQASGDCVARRCVWSVGRPIFVTHLGLGENILALVTKDGEAFTAAMTATTCQAPQDITRNTVPLKDFSRTGSFSLTLSDLVLKDDIVTMSLERVPLVHRATAVWTDQRGTNISVLQSNPNASITCIPCVRPSEMKTHLVALLNDAHLDDSIHDVVLQVGLEKVPLHRFVLTQRSEYFRSRLQSTSATSALTLDCGPSPESPAVLKIDLCGRSAVVFRQLLQFIYSDSCDLVSPGTQFQIYQKSASQVSSEKSSPGAPPTSQKNKRSKKTGKQSKEMPSEEEATSNPIEILKGMAWEFGVKALVKRLESVEYVNGFVVSAPGRSFPSSSLKFDRKANNLSDICIESDDGVDIECHKCLLVGRLEYFRSMFSSAWIETSKSASLQLPFPGEVLKIIVDFLYTDQCVKVSDSCDTDLVCRVLVAADQLLIGRLKDECEAALARLLTLRNVCELLEFASVCYANQLVETCQQFICINLSALLETRALDVLSDEMIEKLTEYYKNSVVGMYRRFITPYSAWPDAAMLESLEKSFLDTPSRTGCGVASPGGGKKGGVVRKRLRTKSSEGNVDVTKPPKQSPPSANPDVICDAQKTSAKETLLTDVDKNCSSFEEKGNQQTYTPKDAMVSKDTFERKLVSSPVAIVTPSKPSSQPSLPSGHSIGSMPEYQSSSLREIMSEELAKEQSAQEIHDQHVTSNSSRWPKKTSQKERKRQGQAAADKVESADSAHNEPTISSGNPWKLVERVVSSFKDLMLTDEIAHEKASVDPVSPLTLTHTQKTSQPPSSRPESKIFNWGILPSPSSPTLSMTPGSPVSEPGSPSESPWLRSPKISASGRSEIAAAARFSDILREEMVETQTLKRTEKKSLHLIQIEEQAMSALLDFYKASESVHEYISVERVSSKTARPLWAATQRQSSHRF